MIIIKVCSKNDILITFDGSPGIVKRGLEGAFSSGIRKVVFLRKNELSENFIYFVLQTDIVKNKINEFSIGVTIKHASKSIPHIKIPLPPLPEQQRIAYILSSIDEQIEAMENKKKAIKELFNSLLKNLMTAKIRVNHLNLKDETVN